MISLSTGGCYPIEMTMSHCHYALRPRLSHLCGLARPTSFPPIIHLLFALPDPSFPPRREPAQAPDNFEALSYQQSLQGWRQPTPTHPATHQPRRIITNPNTNDYNTTSPNTRKNDTSRSSVKRRRWARRIRRRSRRRRRGGSHGSSQRDA